MLRVHLLGEMSVEADGTRLSTPGGRRAWARLAWLAVNPGGHARAEIAARFWPDVLDSSARASLRSAVWALRRGLGPAAGPHLLAGRDELGLLDVEVDARAFAALLEADRLAEAVAVGDGELLPGCDDDWAAEARAAHRERLAGAVEGLAVGAAGAGGAEAGIAWTRRQTALDALDEDAHRRLMRRLAAAGEPAAAAGEYRRLRDRLRRELGVAPSLATRRLAERLREDAALEAESPPSARPPLIGRERELRALLAAWDRAHSGAGGAVVIAGEAGIGKTRLATEV